MSLEDRYNELSDDVKKKAAACKSVDELIELTETCGVELTDEELEAVSGGFWKPGCSDFSADNCPDWVEQS